jgi:predicted NBD/HSP70 family sugar kinase
MTESPAGQDSRELARASQELAREVLIHGPIARSDLGRRLGLSPASLTRLSRPLIDRGLVVEAAERTEGGVGRPARPLDVRVDAQRFVGVKLTGTAAFGALTDLRANRIAGVEVPLTDHSPEAVVAAVARTIDVLSRDSVSTPSGVGVGVGGRVLNRSVVTRAPFLGWRDVDLGAALHDAVGLPIVVENDVVALVEAEHWFGEGRGIDDFAVVTTGAGVGYGLVMHGRQVTTSDTGLGLGGHFPLDPTGPLCSDGHRGCSTAMLSTVSMRAWAATGLGRDVSYPELLELASSGDRVATEVVRSAGRALGRLLAAVSNLTMVQTIVLAGEGIGFAALPAAQEALQAALAADRDPEASPLRILTGSSDFGIWATGAAAVAIQTRFGR